MLVKINRQDAIAQYPKLPLREYDSKNDEDKYFYPKVFANYILTLPSKSYKGHIKLLGNEIVRLANGLSADKLIFLGDEKTPWLYQDRDYKPAKDALQYLADKKLGKKFNGALEVDTAELTTFIMHLCWLVRTNTLVPYVHFIDPNQNVIGNICQYGNLHISTINKKADKHFTEIVATTKLEFLTEGGCVNKFSKSSKIEGRQLTV